MPSISSGRLRAVLCCGLILLSGASGCALPGHGDFPEEYFSPSELDFKPVPLTQTAPIYPAGRHGSQLTVEVMVSFVVDREGFVRSAAVEASSNGAGRDPAFEAAALAAVQQWRFQPGRKDGAAVNVAWRVPIRFQPEPR